MFVCKYLVIFGCVFHPINHCPWPHWKFWVLPGCNSPSPSNTSIRFSVWPVKWNLRPHKVDFTLSTLGTEGFNASLQPKCVCHIECHIVMSFIGQKIGGPKKTSTNHQKPHANRATSKDLHHPCCSCQYQRQRRILKGSPCGHTKGWERSTVGQKLCKVDTFTKTEMLKMIGMWCEKIVPKI